METNLKQKKQIRIFWALLISPILLITLIFTLVNLEVFGKLPGFEELENPKTNLATEIFTSDQVLLGKYFKENRTVVDFKEVSPNVLNALIATEDVRFYQHSGIDARALLRVLQGVITLDLSGGGSTITQQLAKNLYRMRGDSSEYDTGLKGKPNLIITKFKEWVTAVRLEKNYTKQEIIAMYLNTVDFGSNAFGIKSAARTFFNTTPDSLTLEEAATLIGALKAPTALSPKLNPKNSFYRRNTVLEQIEKYQKKLNKLHGYQIKSKEYYDSLQALPINLDYSVQSHTKGIARHFREYIRMLMYKEKPVSPDKPVKPKKMSWKDPEYKKYKRELAQYELQYYRFLEDSTEWEENQLYGWCNKNKKPDGSKYNIYRDGLKIYTTINSEMQIYAEEAVVEHMGEYLQPLFYKRHKGRKKAPFSWNMSEKQIQNVYNLSMKRTERYKRLRYDLKKDSSEIAEIFNTPVEMKIFSWNGPIDTIMTPLDSIKYYKYFLHSGLMSLEPQTGYVKAYVGDINYDYFRYDNVSLSRRQVGSTFKPFVYSFAMEDKMSPCHLVPNVPITIDLPEGQRPPTWTPKFSSNERLDGKMVSLKIGLANSLNQISAWVMKKYGPEKIVEIAHKIGIKSYIPAVPSICVGASEVRLSEMVGAYDTYANGGIHVEPIFVTRIEDKNGNVIAKFKAKNSEALNPNTAYRMIELMKGVVDMGTSVRLRYKYGFRNEIAGKTGTTNNNSDGWFIGFVPNLVTGVWVGGEERSIHFLSSHDGQGASMALPIWALYMQKVYQNEKLGISKEPFKKPVLYDGVILDCNEYRQINNIDDPFDDNY
ncbi:MAG: transglycosylase domain-containing protein [Bacteroidales bacterium]|nr:transglycosylase domain-containing protein [Bacteroidales bacterium]